MSDTEVIEILCEMQDLNKYFKFYAEDEEEIQRCEDVEDNIKKQLQNLYVN